MLEVITIETPELGNRTYLVHDGGKGLVIDPQRDIDRVTSLADSAKIEINFVAETHIHNDYVSGGRALSERTGARYLVAAAEDVAFLRQPLSEGDRVQVGAMTLQALATPGHTRSHLAFVVSDGDRPAALFSGGSLLYGAVGRTDLVSPELTEELARFQHRSALRLAALPEELGLFPTHGFGSFCASGASSPSDAGLSLGSQREVNPALTADEEGFVRALLAGYSDYPRYYAYMGARNLEGAAAPAPDLPPQIDVPEAGRRISAGEWVIDLRPRSEFAPAHVKGTVNFPAQEQLATYIGWVVPWGSPLTVVAESPELVSHARRDLARIGIDQFAGWVRAPLGDLQAAQGGSSYPVTDFRGLAKAQLTADLQILDARRPDEWRQEHIRGSINIHLPDLLSRLNELPDRLTWVHCSAGYRAAVAASLLDRAGRKVVLVDDAIARLGLAGLELESGSV